MVSRGMEQAMLPPVQRGQGRKRLLVIGGGISGLAAAYRAKSEAAMAGMPLDVTLLEASSRVGGLIRSHRVNGCLIEHGPDAVLRKKPAAEALCKRIGLENALAPSPNRGFFVLQRGRITPLPAGFRMLAPTRLLPLFTHRLFSPLAAMRLCLEPLIPVRKGGGEESLGAFVRRRLGGQALERVIQPMLSAIYLGDADKLSADLVLPQLRTLVQKYGSLIKGMKKIPEPTGPAFFSLKGGLETLVEALCETLGMACIQTDMAVERLSLEPNGGWSIRIRDCQPLHADYVILATPAHVSSRVLGAASSGLARLLAGIDYASCMTFHLIYRRDQIDHPLDINGFFVPRSERQPYLAAMSIGTKYPERVPRDLAAIRVFVGGAQQQEWLEKDPDTLAQILHLALKPVLGLRSKPVTVHVAHHPLAMPQLNVGLGARIEEIQQTLAGLPGLFLAGGALGAVGLPACIQSGETAAAQVLAMVGRKQVQPVS